MTRLGILASVIGLGLGATSVACNNTSSNASKAHGSVVFGQSSAADSLQNAPTTGTLAYQYLQYDPNGNVLANASLAGLGLAAGPGSKITLTYNIGNGSQSEVLNSDLSQPSTDTMYSPFEHLLGASPVAGTQLQAGQSWNQPAPATYLSNLIASANSTGVTAITSQYSGTIRGSIDTISPSGYTIVRVDIFEDRWVARSDSTNATIGDGGANGDQSVVVKAGIADLLIDSAAQWMLPIRVGYFYKNDGPSNPPGTTWGEVTSNSGTYLTELYCTTSFDGLPSQDAQALFSSIPTIVGAPYPAEFNKCVSAQ